MLRQAGVRAPILVFGALSVSDLDGIVDHALTPTISTPSAAARAAGDRRQARRRAALSPEDRHRHEPARVRHDNLQHTCRRWLASAHLEIAAVYTHSPPPTTRITRRSRSSVSVSSACSSCCRRSASRRLCGTPPTAPRCCATSASGTIGAPRPDALRHRAASPGGDVAAATCPVTAEPYRGGEGASVPERAPATAPSMRAIARARSPWSPPATPTASISPRGTWLDVLGPGSPRANHRLGVHGHDDDRRHRHGCRTGRRGRDGGRAGSESIGVREMAAAIGTIPHELLAGSVRRIERFTELRGVGERLRLDELK